MPFTAGSFVRTNGTNNGATLWDQDRQDGTLILASRHDTHDQDLADGIDSCIEKTGVNSTSTILNYFGYGEDVTNTDAYIVTLTAPLIAAYPTGFLMKVKITNANTGAATINVNSIGAKDIKKNGTTALAAGDIQGSGHIALLFYDGTNFQLLNPPAPANNWTTISTAATLTSQDQVLIDTSGNAFTVTLPVAPSGGDYVRIADASGNFETNNLTVGRNAELIMGLAEDMTVDVSHSRFALVFQSTANGWRLAT